MRRFFDEQHDIAIINFTVSYIKNQNESTNSLIHSQLNTNGKVKVINGKQEDLLDLITALLKFNCFLSTTVATQCIFQSNL